MTPVIYTYIAYLIISVAFTIWVAATLHKGGRIFLVDAFEGNEQLADSVNHLLVVGFYLVNFGYVFLALKADEPPADLQGIFEIVSGKVGWVLLILGGMHFFNLLVLSRMRARTVRKHAYPPIPAQTRVDVIN